MTKTCSKCHRDLALSAFARSSKGDKLGSRAQCRECCGAYNRAWNRANPESIRAAERRYHARIRGVEIEGDPQTRRPSGSVTLEIIREQKRAWRIANPDKVAAHKRAHYLRHSEQIKARVRQWQRENRNARLLHHHRRRAVQAAAAGATYTTTEHIAARVAYYGERCFYCSRPWESIDHRIPLTRGGSHWPSNLVPACKSCNSRKNTKTEKEFREVMKIGIA